MNESTQTPPFDMARVTQLLQVLRRYREGKRSVEQRLIAAEQWWKLRNTAMEDREGHGKQGFRSRSGWLHNVITSKHADAMDAYPEPTILPREAGDKPEAENLSRLLPCILEQNRFERVWSDAWWSKLKFGTGVYCVAWNPEKLGGVGDVDVRRCDLLNLFWEPGAADIQQSKYFFEIAFVDPEELAARYPEIPIAQTHAALTAVLPYDDRVDLSEKVPVIHCYYHIGTALHYARFTPDAVLFATENDPALAATGLYDHGRYPYVFDPLFPVEGSPCGYGYVDLCKQPQTEIDLMKTAFVENTMNGARPRYFVRHGSGVNREQFLDLNNPLVEVEGVLDDSAIAPIRHGNLDGAYLAMLDRVIAELRETSGNTETSTGTTNSGVTAASAIAALQEASGKGSRDSAMSGYRAYADLVELVIELVRQFYDLPRQFRILGEDGRETFMAWSNRALKAQDAGGGLYRLPVFDIRVVPQKRSAYTKVANNNLALQLFSLGFFRADMADQALRCLTVMDFDGKDALRRVIEQGMVETLANAGEASLSPANPAGSANNAVGEGLAPPGRSRMERARNAARNAGMPRT